MNGLTLWLSVAAGLVLAAVVAHGAWTARKAAGRRPAPPAPTAPTGPIEPVFDTPVDADPSPLADLPPRPARRHVPRIDALIDAIATLVLDAPVSAEMALAHLPATRRAGSKPFLVEGLNTLTGEWEPLQPGQRYGELQAGVQLANRTGGLNEIEYSEFVQLLQASAEPMGATVDAPDMLEVVARARELDAFSGEHDAQLAVHLNARSVAWSVGYIQQHAARHGFVPGLVPGRLVLPAAEEGAPPVLTLAFDSHAALAEDPNQAALRDVTLSFDVPQTDPVAQPFQAWQASAQALALGMDAAIIDDSGQPLQPEGFESIGHELRALYARLAERDLAAGSAAARRLFS